MLLQLIWSNWIYFDDKCYGQTFKALRNVVIRDVPLSYEYVGKGNGNHDLKLTTLCCQYCRRSIITVCTAVIYLWHYSFTYENFSEAAFFFCNADSINCLNYQGVEIFLPMFWSKPNIYLQFHCNQNPKNCIHANTNRLAYRNQLNRGQSVSSINAAVEWTFRPL